MVVGVGRAVSVVCRRAGLEGAPRSLRLHRCNSGCVVHYEPSVVPACPVNVHTTQRVPDSHQNSEVKLRRARVVLWWGTTWEVLVMCFCSFSFLSFMLGALDNVVGEGERRGKYHRSEWGFSILFLMFWD